MNTSDDIVNRELGVPVAVRLEEDQRDALIRRARENDRTLAAEIRRAIRLYLEERAVAS